MLIAALESLGALGTLEALGALEALGTLGAPDDVLKIMDFMLPSIIDFVFKKMAVISSTYCDQIITIISQ